MTNKSLKISDIAKKLNISSSTISRALTNPNLVAKKTRKFILKEVNKLKYIPNIHARNLRTKSSKTILFLVRDIDNQFYFEVFRGIEKVAKKSGYSVLMGSTDNDLKKEIDFFNMVKSNQVDGMILMTGRLPSRKIFSLNELKQMPIILSLEDIPEVNFNSLTIDNFQAAKEATNYLIKLGHKKIAHIASPLSETRIGILRRDGYRHALKESGIKINFKYEYIGDYTVESGAAACKKLFKGANIPTAIFCSNDEMAYGAINQLRRMKISVPNKVSVIGFDDLPMSKSFYPPLSTIYQPRFQIGEKSMELLFEKIKIKKNRIDNIKLKTKLIIRESSAKIKK